MQLTKQELRRLIKIIERDIREVSWTEEKEALRKKLIAMRDAIAAGGN